MNAKSSLILIFAAALTIVSGILHGRMVQRWGPSSDMLRAAEGLMEFPEQIGPWRVKSDEPLSAAADEMLQLAGHVNRIYRHEDTGARVSVVLMVGPAGPLASHTPDVCYPSNNYAILQPRQSVSISGENEAAHEFSHITFRVNDTTQRNLRVYYAWNRGDQWQAPALPRYYFAGGRLLYKIQIAGHVQINSDEQSDPCRVFLQSALPQLTEVIKPVD